MQYDLETDRHFVLTEFPAGVDCLQLATADFDTFYVAATEVGYKDSSQSAVGVDEDVLQQYDATMLVSEAKVKPDRPSEMR